MGRDRLSEEDQPDASSDSLPDPVSLSSKASEIPSQSSRLNAPAATFLYPPLQERALAFYRHYYLDAPGIDFSGIKQHTQEILTRSYTSSEPVFTYAVAAESLLLFGKLNHDSRSIVLAHQAYHDALKETTNSLPIPSRACSDRFLIAIMIFSSFEVRTSNFHVFS